MNVEWKQFCGREKLLEWQPKMYAIFQEQWIFTNFEAKILDVYSTIFTNPYGKNAVYYSMKTIIKMNRNKFTL